MFRGSSAEVCGSCEEVRGRGRSFRTGTQQKWRATFRKWDEPTRAISSVIGPFPKLSCAARKKQAKDAITLSQWSDQRHFKTSLWVVGAINITIAEASVIVSPPSVSVCVLVSSSFVINRSPKKHLMSRCPALHPFSLFLSPGPCLTHGSLPRTVCQTKIMSTLPGLQ